MNAPTKFLFDVDFAGGGDRKTTIALAEHARQVSEADSAGYRRGFAEGQADAKVAAERRIADALECIGKGLAETNAALGAVEVRLECEAVEVAVAVARKLAPALIAREPLAEIMALANECFRQLVSSPHIAVRVNDAVYDAARQKLDDAVRARGLEGRLIVLSDPDIAPGDCRIEWADGGINRDSAAIEAAIADAVAGYLSARCSFAAAQEGRRKDNG